MEPFFGKPIENLVSGIHYRLVWVNFAFVVDECEYVPNRFTFRYIPDFMSGQFNKIIKPRNVAHNPLVEFVNFGQSYWAYPFATFKVADASHFIALPEYRADGNYQE